MYWHLLLGDNWAYNHRIFFLHQHDENHYPFSHSINVKLFVRGGVGGDNDAN